MKRARTVDTTVNHYSGPGDSPGWDTNGSTTHRYLSDASGALTATITTITGGQATGQIQIADPNGGITTTIQLTDAPGLDDVGSLTLTTEFGLPASDQQAGLYGWHGAAQRPTSKTSGLIQMGVRMYNPATGQFLTIDPVPGGNTTPYTYPPKTQRPARPRWQVPVLRARGFGGRGGGRSCSNAGPDRHRSNRGRECTP